MYLYLKKYRYSDDYVFVRMPVNIIQTLNQGLTLYRNMCILIYYHCNYNNYCYLP